MLFRSSQVIQYLSVTMHVQFLCVTNTVWLDPDHTREDFFVWNRSMQFFPNTVFIDLDQIQEVCHPSVYQTICSLIPDQVWNVWRKVISHRWPCYLFTFFSLQHSWSFRWGLASTPTNGNRCRSGETGHRTSLESTETCAKYGGFQ